MDLELCTHHKDGCPLLLAPFSEWKRARSVDSKKPVGQGKQRVRKGPRVTGVGQCGEVMGGTA